LEWDGPSIDLGQDENNCGSPAPVIAKEVITMKKGTQQRDSEMNWGSLNLAAALGVGLLLISGGSGLHGQSLQQKDLMFPQVATGAAIETAICVTNRGSDTYRGNLRFWKGTNEVWNPVINGVPVQGSSAKLEIDPGETRVLTITGDSGLAVGAAALEADDLSQDNFVEGNLVYSISGPNPDSVGIAPSSGFYTSVVPFEEISSVGLALANPALWESAVVRLRLFDAGGELRKTVVRLLAERSHEAKFLSELFGESVDTGKVEIESDRPIIATAVTLVEGEMSALPVLPSPVSYTFHTENQGEVDEAEVVLWADGIFVEGYMRFLEVAGQPVNDPENFLVTGSLVNGVLRLTQFGAGPEVGGQETVNYLKIQGFSFGGEFWTGKYTRIMNGFPFYNVIDGDFDLIRR
jgi:hypothetical protein